MGAYAVFYRWGQNNLLVLAYFVLILLQLQAAVIECTACITHLSVTMRHEPKYHKQNAPLVQQKFQ